MAILLPARTGASVKSTAERRLLRRLEVGLGDQWFVLHSVGLVRHAKKRWAEADFVLAGPAGLLVLEVKGGRVSRTAGTWTYLDRNDRSTRSAEGPFDQAGGAAGALQQWLSTRVERDSGNRFQVGYAVATPDCTLSIDGPDIERDLLLDASFDGTVADFVRRVFDHWTGRNARFTPLQPHEAERFVEAVRSDFQGQPSLRAQLGQVEDEIVRTTDGQRVIMEALSSNPRLLVTGGAGTGKTMLAIEEVLRLSTAGKRTLYLCHNRMLRDAVSEGIGARQGVTVRTQAQLMLEVGGGSVPDDPKDRARFWHSELPRQAIEKQRDEPSPRFDALVVDEGQDLLREKTIELLDLLLESGINRGCWRWFMDPNQQLFGEPEARTLDRLGAAAPSRFHLSVNCRTTAQIAGWASMVSGGELPQHSPIQGPDVKMTETSDNEVAAAVQSAVETFIIEGVAPTDVAVLLRRPDAESFGGESPVGSSLRRLGVRVETAARFKGLECSAVVVAGFASFGSEADRRSAYVALTRARHVAHFVVTNAARPSFDRQVESFAKAMATRIREGPRGATTT